MAMSEHKPEQEEARQKAGETVEIYVPTIMYYSPPEEGEQILKELGEAKEECRG